MQSRERDGLGLGQKAGLRSLRVVCKHLTPYQTSRKGNYQGASLKRKASHSLGFSHTAGCTGGNTDNPLHWTLSLALGESVGVTDETQYE